jgi:hypothetical protein
VIRVGFWPTAAPVARKIIVATAARIGKNRKRIRIKSIKTQDDALTKYPPNFL